MASDGRTEAAVTAADRWQEAVAALALFAVDPSLGLRLHARAGFVREAALALLKTLLPADIPFRRMPAGIGDAALVGGLDLAASLDAGRPVAERGLLASCDGGVLVAAMAERLPPGTAAVLADTLDTGAVRLERDGLSAKTPARLGILALDEGMEDDEAPPPALAERLGLWVDLEGADPRGMGDEAPAAEAVFAARRRLTTIAVDDDAVMLLCQAAAAFGIASLRVPSQALKAARAAAALAARDQVAEADLDCAIRHVLLPRATRMPAGPDERDEPQEPDRESEAPQDAAPPEAGAQGDAPQDDDVTSADGPDDVTVAASDVALPADLLDRLSALMAASPSAHRGAGRSGSSANKARRGRIVGTREGDPRRERLDLAATLRSAAPWQPLRRREAGRAPAEAPAGASKAAASGRILVRSSDIRVRRYRGKAETATIFAVDASGSAALARLAEAKGAVERILAECYVRRERVALVAFRGTKADVLLPETKSLTRAKRSLAAFPAGGGTPLASGIAAALALARTSARDGRRPLIALLTDGRANIARDGAAGRPAAQADALAAARAVRAAGIAALLVDVGQRQGSAARELAVAMGATYLALPRADSQALSDAVGAASREASGSARHTAAAR
ncbi:magnesium chelatase subunit D [Jiella sp. M17.18]|uniref:magnesium chelatase subunit D n=1 Tax=Jiella sp. M17.18 TaxID=3234247 RepID=UPI0034DFF9D7